MEKGSETSNKFVFRCNNESYLVQCEMPEQTSWYEDIQFAIDNCDSKPEELSLSRKVSPVSPSPRTQVNSRR